MTQKYRNWAYEVICRRHKGWGACADGLWPPEYVERAARIFATAAEARELCWKFRTAGCWTVEDDETGERRDETPDFRVRKLSAYEACWMDDDDQDVIDRLIDIHGRDIVFSRMPRSVAAYLVQLYGGTSEAWMRESANLAGASSATHTAAFIGARFSRRVADIKRLYEEG